MIRNGVIYKLAARYYSPPCGLRVWLCFSLILPALGGRQSGAGVRRVEPRGCGVGDSERLHKQPPQNLRQVEPCRLEKHFSYFGLPLPLMGMHLFSPWGLCSSISGEHLPHRSGMPVLLQEVFCRGFGTYYLNLGTVDTVDPAPARRHGCLVSYKTTSGPSVWVI